MIKYKHWGTFFVYKIINESVLQNYANGLTILKKTQ